jgi:hypothetical protein
MKVVLRTMIPSGTVVCQPDPETIVGIDPLGRFEGASPAAILAVQGVAQTLKKNPGPSGANEEPEPVAEDYGEAYVPRLRRGPNPEGVKRTQGTIHAPEPAYGTPGVLRGMAYRRRG